MFFFKKREKRVFCPICSNKIEKVILREIKIENLKGEMFLHCGNCGDFANLEQTLRLTGERKILIQETKDKNLYRIAEIRAV